MSLVDGGHPTRRIDHRDDLRTGSPVDALWTQSDREPVELVALRPLGVGTGRKLHDVQRRLVADVRVLGPDVDVAREVGHDPVARYRTPSAVAPLTRIAATQT